MPDTEPGHPERDDGALTRRTDQADFTRSPGKTQPAYRGTGVSAALVVGVVLTVVALIVAFQNSEDTNVDFLAWELDAPLVVVIVAAVLAGVLLDEIAGVVWRRRRRQRLTEREELRGFRSSRSRH